MIAAFKIARRGFRLAVDENDFIGDSRILLSLDLEWKTKRTSYSWIWDRHCESLRFRYSHNHVTRGWVLRGPLERY